MLRYTSTTNVLCLLLQRDKHQRVCNYAQPHNRPDQTDRRQVEVEVATRRRHHDDDDADDDGANDGEDGFRFRRRVCTLFYALTYIRCGQECRCRSGRHLVANFILCWIPTKYARSITVFVRNIIYNRSTRRGLQRMFLHQLCSQYLLSVCRSSVRVQTADNCCVPFASFRFNAVSIK